MDIVTRHVTYTFGLARSIIGRKESGVAGKPDPPGTGTAGTAATE